MRYKRLHNTRNEEELLAVYFFADEYNVPQLRKDVLDTLVKGLDNLGVKPDPRIDTILTVYELLSTKSPMKKWLVDRAARNWNTILLLCEVATGAYRIQELV